MRQIIGDEVQLLLWKLEANLPNPDEGLTLKPELERELLEEIKKPASERRGKPLQQIAREMGLEELFD